MSKKVTQENFDKEIKHLEERISNMDRFYRELLSFLNIDWEKERIVQSDFWEGEKIVTSYKFSKKEDKKSNKK